MAGRVRIEVMCPLPTPVDRLFCQRRSQPVERHVSRRLTFIVLSLLPGAGACVAQVPPGACAGAAVSARGEPASYRWLALVKARGNWRSRVRTTPELGSSFADWTAATDQVERCIEGDGSVVCTVTGIPCRR